MSHKYACGALKLQSRQMLQGSKSVHMRTAVLQLRDDAYGPVEASRGGDFVLVDGGRHVLHAVHDAVLADRTLPRFRNGKFSFFTPSHN